MIFSMNIKEQLENYKPFNEQEIVDKNYFLEFISTFQNTLTRENLFGHFTSSAFIVNKERTKFLGVYHIIQDGWTYPGGHADGESDLLKVALREAKEETGIEPKVVDTNFFGIHSGPVVSHIKRRKFVPAHIHFDFIYLMEADENLPLIYRENESKGIKWISFKDADKENFVTSIKPSILKLIDKIKEQNL